MKRLFLIRHLETENNRNGILMGRKIDAPIIADEQVGKFKKKIILLKKSFENLVSSNMVIFTSPRIRCQETANIFSKILDFRGKIRIDKSLDETDMGDFVGHHVSELRSIFGDKPIEDWMYRPTIFSFPSGESYQEVHSRVDKFLSKLTKSDCENVFVCTHVDLIKIILLNSLGSSFDNRRHLIIPPGSVSILSLLSKEGMCVESVNSMPF